MTVYSPSEAEVCLTVKASLGYIKASLGYIKASLGYIVRPLSKTTTATKTNFKQKPKYTGLDRAAHACQLPVPPS